MLTSLRALGLAAAIAAPLAPAALAQTDIINLQDYVTGLNVTRSDWPYPPYTGGTASFTNGGLLRGNPVGMVTAPGQPNRQYIVLQTGQIMIVDNGVLNTTPFLDIGNRDVATGDAANPYSPAAGTLYLLNRVGGNFTATVSGVQRSWTYTRFNEQGLLGVAFAPDYATSGIFYVYFVGALNNNVNPGFGPTGIGTATDAGQSVLMRFRRSSTDPNRADITSRQTILTVTQPFVNHNGGSLQFGPDGMLYLGLGDGGSGNDPNNDALDPSLLLGKIIRIDVGRGDFTANPTFTYTIPADNPTFSMGTNSGTPRRENWLIGLRNPWRFSFDRWNNDLYIADVGQDAWEEVNYLRFATAGGRNMGWRSREGLNNTGLNALGFPTTNLTDPIYVYPHNIPAPTSSTAPRTPLASGFTTDYAGSSLTGGYVYRGKAIPAMRGRYFFGDYVSGRVWSFRVVNGNWIDFQVHTSQIVSSPSVSLISSFAEDAAGELYLIQLNGRIRKFVPQNPQPNLADVASLGGQPGYDGQRTVDDIVYFLAAFFAGDQIADVASLGGALVPDDQITADDLVAFLNAFFGP